MASTDVIVTFGADLTKLKEGFAEAGVGAEGLDTKVKGLSTSTASIKSDSVTKLTSDLTNTSTATKGLKTDLADVSKASTLENAGKDATNYKQILQSTSKEARGLNMTMKAFGDSGSPMLKELGATTRLGAAFTGDAQGAGVLGMVMSTFGGILLPAIAIVLAITAGFAVLYATSKTFRDMISGVVTTLQNIVGWVKELVGDLMSGNFSKFGDDLKTGFEGAINSIKNFDFGAWAGKMAQVFVESFNTIKNIDWGGIGNSILSAISQYLDWSAQVRSSFMKVDWGGMLNGFLTAIDNVLTQLLSFDPTSMINNIINAIGGAFDSLFGGAGSKGDVGGQVSKSVQKAGPDILGKLGDVFVKLLVLLPTIFGKIGLALFTALSKVDWGAVFSKLAGAAVTLGTALMSALKGVDWKSIFTLIFVTLTYFGQAIIKAFQTIDWGKAFTTLMAALGVVANAFLTWIIGLPWGTWALDLWNDIVAALATFGTWLWGLISPLPGQLWAAIVGALGTFGTWLWGLISSAVGQFGSWLEGLVSGIGQAIWGFIQSAVGGFGTDIIGQVSGLAGAIGSAITTGISGMAAGIQSAVSGLGGWLTTSAASFFSGIPAAFSSALGQVKVTLDTTPPFLHISLAEGGIVSPHSGGILATLAEAGEPEVVVPWHRVGEDWGSLISSLPTFGGGGVVVPSGSVGFAGSKQSGTSGVTNYNTYVTVDSESMTRKVLAAHVENERYHHLAGWGQ